MSNSHQRFTGININGSGRHGIGLWKSLCGTANDDIIDVYYEVTGNTPQDWEIGHAKWLLGASLWYGEPVQCADLDAYRSLLKKQEGAKDVSTLSVSVPSFEPRRERVRVEEIGREEEAVSSESLTERLHESTTMSAALLYPADKDWLFADRVFSLDNESIEAYLESPAVQAVDGVAVTLHVGSKSTIRSIPFDAREKPGHVRDVLKKIIRAGKSPICFVANPEFYWLTLDHHTDELFEVMEFSGREFSDLVSCFVVMWEIGKAFNGQRLNDRSRLVQRLRKGTEVSDRNTVRIYMHERASEGIPRSDFKYVDTAYTGSALQCGFNTPLREKYEGPDGHLYRGCVGFVKANVDRWRGYDRDHAVVVAETSIPYVYQGQPWRPTRTFDEARAWSQTIVRESGCATDWSGGFRP